MPRGTSAAASSSGSASASSCCTSASFRALSERAGAAPIRGPHGHSALPLPSPIGVLHTNENGVRIMTQRPSYKCTGAAQRRAEGLRVVVAHQQPRASRGEPAPGRSVVGLTRHYRSTRHLNQQTFQGHWSGPTDMRC